MKGRTILASRLGYRITALFVDRFLGRMFETPDAVFPEEMLRPEKQGLEIVRRRRGRHCGSAAARGAELFRGRQRGGRVPSAEGAAAHHGIRQIPRHQRGRSRLRAMFTRESLLESDWYKDRLKAKQAVDIALWTRHTAALEKTPWQGRLTEAYGQLNKVKSESYLRELVGTIGADPSTRPPHGADGFRGY